MRFLFLGMALFLAVALPARAADKESAFARVTRTNVLRCGYVVLPPQFERDPNTGKFSGIAYDIVTEAAHRLGLKVEWTEQVNFATVAEGLKDGRYDAFCLTTYRWSNLARVLDYTDPIFYSTTDAYVRADDKRFDRDLALVNAPTVTIASVDGEGAETIRDENFPKAKLYSMPQDTAVGMLLEAVADGKADVAFTNPLVATPFLLSHPGRIRRITGQNPVRAYAHALAFAKGELELVATFNVVLDEMRNSGVTDGILDRHEAIANSLVRVKSPVRVDRPAPAAAPAPAASTKE